MEILNLNPHPVLSQLISNYTFIDDNSLLRSITLRGTASGNTQLYFFYNPVELHMIRIHNGDTYSGIYNSLITGQFTGPTMINANSRVKGFIVDFTPVGIMNLFNISGIELYETFYEVNEVLGRDFILLQEQVKEQKIISNRKKVLDDFFLAKFIEQGLSYSCTRLNPVVQQIMQNKGCVDLSMLRSMAGISKRYFEKQFRELVGTTPSTLKRIMRVNQAIGLIHQNLNHFDIIAALNYYDQAHFIKEVKWFTGITPKKLTNKGMAVFGDSISILEQKS